MKGNKLYFNQIQDAIRKVESYVKGFDKAKFLEDEKTQSAVILQLTLIGEISMKISDKTKVRINIPWEQIVGFRNRAIHNYFEMNLDVIWDTVKIDIPVLKTKIQKEI